MENASKALIIAGAILISILIIGLGVYIYNMASSTSKKVNLNSQEAEAHNQQFTTYFGERQSSTDVKNLMNTVRSNNITGKTGEETQYIFIKFDGSYKNASDLQSLVSPGHTYEIKVDNDNAITSDDAGDVAVDAKGEDGSSPAVGDQAYYDSGYLRIITITTN